MTKKLLAGFGIFFLVGLMASTTINGVRIVAGDLTVQGIATLANGAVLGSPASIVLPSGATGTTQSANDNSTKIATTAYVDATKTTKAAIIPITVGNWTTIGSSGTRTDTTGPGGGGAIVIDSTTGANNEYGVTRTVAAGDFSYDFIVYGTIGNSGNSQIGVGFSNGTAIEGVCIVFAGSIANIGSWKDTALSGGTITGAVGGLLSGFLVPTGGPYIVRLFRTGTALAGSISIDAGISFIPMFNDTGALISADRLFVGANPRTSSDKSHITLISSTLP